MSATPAKSKQTSRWGSLLQGAVAGLESRLDTILAEDTARATRNVKSSETVQPATNAEVSHLSRRSSVNGASAALLEHARESAAGSDGQRSSSLRLSSRTRVKSRSPAPSGPESRASLDSASSDLVVTLPVNSFQHDGLEDRSMGGRDRLAFKGHEMSLPNGVPSELSSRPSTELEGSTGAARLVEDWRSVDGGEEVGEVARQAANGVQEHHSHTIDDHERAELQRQEETHAYLERIDALQAKLQYLAKEAAIAAQQAASEAPSGSLEAKLATKDEQIALLIEEGRKLSKAEVTHASTIRKLRLKIAEDTTASVEVKRKLSKSEQSLADLTEKLRKLELQHRDAVARTSRLSKEINELNADRAAKDERIEALVREAENASRRAEIEDQKALSDAIMVERKLVQSLREELAETAMRTKLFEERSAFELRKSHEELDRERERNRSAELDMRNEISVLESRLEAFRARTEEASSSVTGDAQAKLLRQIETLQSQYALASENWQGIESSLQARLTNVEKERDDAIKAEGESRKRLRELSSNSRRLQDQMDDILRRGDVLQADLFESKAHAAHLQSQMTELEKSRQTAADALVAEREASEARLWRRLEEEKVKWRQETNPVIAELSPSPNYSRTTPSQRASRPEMVNISMRRKVNRYSSTDLSASNVDRNMTRPRSAVATKFPESASPSTPASVDGQASSDHADDQEDYFATALSPRQTATSTISASTVGAGPSVQIVERMSAAVRRLESEKAATRDELNRLTAQRDESRKEVVSLMREVEDKRAGDAKFETLQKEYTAVAECYKATLEMLGEKSERVEELEADVADLKKMYRDLVETTVK